MTYLKTLARAAGLGLCVAALSGSALADPGKGNGNGPESTPPGQEKKAETPAAAAPAPAPAAAPAPQAAHGQEQKAENQAKQAEKQAAPKPAAKPASSKSTAAKAAAPGQAKKAEKQAEKSERKAEKPAKTSGSFKNTSSGTDLKKGMAHKHTICHATGSESNPFVVITPSVSGVFNGHIGHQGEEDIIPPFVYKGTTYSQNWDAEGQALFANGCAAPAGVAPLAPPTPQKKDEEKKQECPSTVTTTERVLVGVWHATGAIKDGQRKFVFITPSLNSAHYDASKHSDDIPVYEERTVSVTASAESCKAITPTQNVTPPTSNVLQPQPVVPTAAGQPLAPGTVGVLPTVSPSPAGGVAGAVSPAPAAEKVAKAEKPAGGVLGAVASAPEAVAETAVSGELPFTGIPLWIAALIGGALLATGLVLRRTTS